MAVPPPTGAIALERPRPFGADEPATGSTEAAPTALPMINGKVVDPAEMAALLEPMTAREAIAWARETFGDDNLKFAVSFQKTSSVVIDLASSIGPGSRFFYIDTDLLFDETYAVRDELAERYGIEFEREAGISLAEQEELHGANLWRRQPDVCCGLRKVEPMRQALDGALCWVAGLRRSDSQTRSRTPKLAWDKRFGLWKLNPLADWSDEQIWNHLLENNVPYNELHDQGFPSIGCTPCTARPAAGGDDRSGRWAGLDKNECGING